MFCLPKCYVHYIKLGTLERMHHIFKKSLWQMQLCQITMIGVARIWRVQYSKSLCKVVLNLMERANEYVGHWHKGCIRIGYKWKSTKVKWKLCVNKGRWQLISNFAITIKLSYVYDYVLNIIFSCRTRATQTLQNCHFALIKYADRRI